MLAALGDLVEDVIVSQRESLNPDSDTAAVITRRRGGSASHVAAVGARQGSPTRFIGQVGDDDVGRSLAAELSSAGVDTGPVRFSGTTGTIVVLVDEHGERTMFTDRRACLALVDPDPAWLDGIGTLHVPFYSLAEQPISETAQTVIAWAHERGIAVSIDVSSESVITSYGPRKVVELLRHVAPDVVFANEAEARVLAVTSSLVGATTVVKRGSRTALLHAPGSVTVEIPAVPVAAVTDTTGAGDAFAAGFLTYAPATGPGWREDPVAACHAGHHAAAELITSR